VSRAQGAVRTSVTLLVHNIGNTALGFRLRFFFIFAQLLAGDIGLQEAESALVDEEPI
jgi:hypothetical protein